MEPGRRVVITGMGAITPVGTGLDRFWESLVAGKSGMGRITHFDPSALDTRIGAEVKDFDPLEYIDKREVRRMDLFTQYGVAATSMALEDAGIRMPFENPHRSGVIFGTGIGGISTCSDQMVVLLNKGPSRVSPLFIPMMITNMAAGQIAIMTGAKGPNTTVTTACAASANALGEAFRLIRHGFADLIISGGSEATFVPLAVAGFCSMKALSTRNDDPERASRPFDRERDGFVMGEGAGVMILEELEQARARGARIWAEIIGYGCTADAYHVTAPAPGGEGGRWSMIMAMQDAKIGPGDVDYINAHGTSTPANDKSETQAIKDALGEERAHQVPVSSTKSMTGHLLGASGVVELVATILGMHKGIIHPTANYDYPDPECDLDYVPEPRPADVRVALSNSFGFGGQNATLVVRRGDLVV
jgi:3-oxoacyl-[acyl-carrier-protein] synthase II